MTSDMTGVYFIYKMYSYFTLHVQYMQNFWEEMKYSCLQHNGFQGHTSKDY